MKDISSCSVSEPWQIFILCLSSFLISASFFTDLYWLQRKWPSDVGSKIINTSSNCTLSQNLFTASNKFQAISLMIYDNFCSSENIKRKSIAEHVFKLIRYSVCICARSVVISQILDSFYKKALWSVDVVYMMLLNDHYFNVQWLKHGNNQIALPHFSLGQKDWP